MTAVNHPLRRRILRIYVDDGPASASAQEIAKATMQPVARVSYHLRTLAHCDLLRLVQAPGEHRAGGRALRWALNTDAAWLRLTLELWAQSDLPD